MSDQSAERGATEVAGTLSPTDRRALELEVKSRLAGHDLVGELLTERRREAEADTQRMG